VSDSLAVERLHVAWWVDPAAAGDDARRAGLTEALVDHGLAEAFDRWGFGGGEEVCVGSVTVPPVELEPGVDDATFVRRWADAAVGAVAAAVAVGEAGVVRYRSRLASLADMASRSAMGDDRRRWAWRRLGLWPEGLADEDAVATALARSPQWLVGVLGIAARSGALAAVLDLLGTDRVRRLVAAAWVASGGDLAGLEIVRQRPDGVLASAATRSRAARVLDATPLGAGLRRLGPISNAGYAVDLAAAAVLAAEPAAAARAAIDRSALGLVAGVGGALVSSRPANAPISARDVERADEPGVAPATGDGAGTAPREPGPEAAGRGDPEAGAAASDEPARTAFGGLLFLVHLVDALGPVRLAAADPLLADAPLPAVLHRLGTVILARTGGPAGGPPAPPDPRDPALLAFCGLPPEADPPSAGIRAGVGDLWRDRVGGWAERLIATLRAAFDPAELASAPEGELLAAVCRRRAGIAADPGWIDVRLELDEVSTEVRRAGLDLDLGFVPWLGCVVRFVYG
jgi:hypothetical protein